MLKKYIKILFIISFIASFYLCKDIITPFIISIVIAYIFNPIKTKLTRFVKSQTFVAAIIVTIISLGLIVLFIILLPIIYNELNNLINMVIAYSSNIKSSNFVFLKDHFATLDEHAQSKIHELFSNASGQIFTYLTKLVSNILNSSLSFFNIVSNILLIPIISFYFIRDYDDIRLKLANIINLNIALINNMKLKNIANNINLIIKNYLKGQTIICSIMAIYYFTCLKALGLKYSLTLALISGIFIIIPYLGFAISLILTLTIGFIESLTMIQLGIISIIYIIGQIAESNFITPKLIGDRLDLHPVWIIFAVTLCGNIFGIIGAIIAVPLAAIVRFLITDFYRYSTQKG